MKRVLIVNGSPNRDRTTKEALKIAAAELNTGDFEITWFELGTKPARGCIDCCQCETTHRCAFNDDNCNELIEKMLQADAIIIGTPVYFAGPNGALCALLDRVFYATANFGQLLKGKIGASITTCWRAGATATIDRINKYYTYSQMQVASSDYWNGYFGADDDFGAEAIRTLTRNVAELLKAKD